jgi:hypothetical protein
MHWTTNNKIMLVTTGSFLVSSSILAFVPVTTNPLTIIYLPAEIFVGLVGDGFERLMRLLLNYHPPSLALYGSDVFSGSLIFVWLCTFAGFAIGWIIQRFVKSDKWSVLCIVLAANAVAGLFYSY